MREVTKLMIHDYNLKKLGYDFMGYTFKNKNELSFHHMIVPHRDSKKILGNNGYIRENGAILVQETSHEYLHRIEEIDPEIFYLITSELIDENIKGKVDIDNLKKMRDLLVYFEREHCADTNCNGKIIIKPEYIEKRIKL